MKTIGMSETTINDVLHVLAGILMIGNIEFVSTGGAQVRDRSGKSESLFCVGSFYSAISPGQNFFFF